jgi:hypothetical protein
MVFAFLVAWLDDALSILARKTTEVTDQVIVKAEGLLEKTFDDTILVIFHF